MTKDIKINTVDDIDWNLLDHDITYVMVRDGQPRRIHLIGHSIAFTDGDAEIYINRNLKSYDPILFDKILEHELGHKGGSYDSDDLQHDMNTEFPLWQKLNFCARYPKALYYLSPVVVTETKIAISWLQVLQLLIWLGCAWLLFWWVL